MFREGKLLVCRDGADLPFRCPLSDEKVAREDVEAHVYTWCPGWLGVLAWMPLLIPLPQLLYWSLLPRYQRQVEIHMALGRSYKRWRRVKIALALVVIVIGLVVMLSAVFTGNPIPGVVGVCIAVGGLILVGCACRHLSAVKLDDEYVYLSGCCRKFLQRFPERDKEGRPRSD